MNYVLLEWFYNTEDEPYLFYSEIDNQRYEVKKSKFLEMLPVLNAVTKQ